MKLFKITKPKAEPVPILVSIPHAGIKFPKGLKKKFDKRLVRYLDDTDWYVDRLYDFAPKMGITVIKANFSRWVIDLNRNPENKSLYQDNRHTTATVPTTDFFGNALYKRQNSEPDEKESAYRLERFYWPYHNELHNQLNHLKKKFGQALLWDAHSIRHLVSTIQENPFPDMILGDNDGISAHPKLIEASLSCLKSGPFQVNHNSPFKGGHITRHFGNPEQNIHALQLEMNKISYMDDNEFTFNVDRARQVKTLLKSNFEQLIQLLSQTL